VHFLLSFSHFSLSFLPLEMRRPPLYKELFKRAPVFHLFRNSFANRFLSARTLALPPLLSPLSDAQAPSLRSQLATLPFTSLRSPYVREQWLLVPSIVDSWPFFFTLSPPPSKYSERFMFELPRHVK